VPTAWIPGARCLGQKYRSSTDRCEILEKFSRKGGIFCERCVVHVAKFCKCISVSLSLSLFVFVIYIYIYAYRVHMYIYLYAYIYIYVYAIPSFFSQGGETGSSICGKTGNDLRLCFLVKFETH